MAKDPQAEHVEEAPAPLEPHIVSPAHRQRLQKCFEHATKLSTQEKKPDYDYAHTLFSECVKQDPSNLVYVQAMLDNLERKYDRNRKGARMGSFGGARAALKKAAAKGAWREALALGPDALQANPWDVPSLRALARACAAHHYNEVELRYLKNALEANSKDIEVNRHCAESLARMGQFDQAIACWYRVEEFGKEHDKREAQEKISELTIERARGRSGLPGEARPLPSAPLKSVAKLKEVAGAGAPPSSEPARETAPPPAAEAPSPPKPAPAKAPVRQPATPKPPRALITEDDEPGEIIASPEQAAALAGDDLNDEFRRGLEKAIADDPTDAASYRLLADLLVEGGQFEQAARLLERGLTATGQNLDLVERLEDLQIERAAHQAAVAEKLAASQGTAEAERLANDLKKELNLVELSVYRQRVQRYPDDGDLRFELGLRLKRAGNHEEAIACFAEVGDGDSCGAAAALEMGESLQYLKRYHEALEEYERAVQRAAGDADVSHRKKALYRAGVLATGMRKLDKAEVMLLELQSLDPDYKDLAARLDKIRRIRDSG